MQRENIYHQCPYPSTLQGEEVDTGDFLEICESVLNVHSSKREACHSKAEGKEWSSGDLHRHAVARAHLHTRMCTKHKKMLH